MGCVSSRQKRCHRCRHREFPEMARRSNSGHLHRPSQHAGRSFHTVALTSSTLGSLSENHKHFEDVLAKLVADDSNGGNGINNRFICNGCYEVPNGNLNPAEEEESNWNFQDIRNGNLSHLQERLNEAKTWASMMDEKIPKLVPKTPIVTPPGEPETINTWELMEGLEDPSPLRSPDHPNSFSFGGHNDEWRKQSVTVKSMLLHTQEMDQNSNSKSADFDPMIIQSFRKSLQELPPDHPFHIRVPGIEKNENLEFSDENEDVERERSSLSKHKVVLYFTSLRGVRKTYEDCCNARVILKSFGVHVDERDLSMDLRFKGELKELMSYNDEHNIGVGITLPRVFLGKKYIGGAEEIKKLNEEGKLEKLLEGSKMVVEGDEGCECEVCGDIRFVPCDTCNGSCKIYYEFDEEDEGEDDGNCEKCDNGFRRCPDCNENGLIRCPVCCN